jgi:hypothetical protein
MVVVLCALDLVTDARPPASLAGLLEAIAEDALDTGDA